MEINLYLLLSLLIALLVISYLLGKLHRVRGQLFLIRDALNDIKAGNLNRRVLVRESDLTKQICYFRKLCDPTELFLKKFYLGKVMARFAFYNWNHERRKPYDDYYN